MGHGGPPNARAVPDSGQVANRRTRAGRASLDAHDCTLFTFAGNPTGTPTTNTSTNTNNYVTRQTSGCFATTGSAAPATPAAKKARKARKHKKQRHARARRISRAPRLLTGFTG